MSSKPGPSMSYRSPTVDEDDDDLDDLDDVLAAFNAPAASSTVPPSRSAAPAVNNEKIRSPNHSGEEEEEDFEASLVEGMESLLRQLAGDHPPGPMPDKTPGLKTSLTGDVKPGTRNATLDKGEEDDPHPPGDLSKDEEEEAWQRAIDMMLSGEGLEALGLDRHGAGSTGGEEEKKADIKPDFDETIRRTMESLRSPEMAAGSGRGDKKPDVEELLKQLGSDPSALGGLAGEDDELGGLLDGMMAQLMTKEVLEEPMAELASKYPIYLFHPPSDLPPASLQKYRTQHHLVQSILDTFHSPTYSDEKDGKEVARLVGEMQDLGGPPKEIMGELPEGFNLDALGGLGGEEGCLVM